MILLQLLSQQWHRSGLFCFHISFCASASVITSSCLLLQLSHCLLWLWLSYKGPQDYIGPVQIISPSQDLYHICSFFCHGGSHMHSLQGLGCNHFRGWGGSLKPTIVPGHSFSCSCSCISKCQLQPPWYVSQNSWSHHWLHWVIKSFIFTCLDLSSHHHPCYLPGPSHHHPSLRLWQ